MMTTGESLYLLLVLVAFGFFMGVLAFHAQRYRPARRQAAAPAKPPAAQPLAERSHAR